VRSWPWILVALASLIVYPHLTDIQTAFPHLDHKLLGDDIAYPAMLKVLPVGFMGLMIGGLIAANSSTVLSHLNWGASYIVHDFYQRFVNPEASEKHYILVGRLTTVGLYVAAAGLTFVLNTAKDAFNIIIQVGAGTGLLYLARWFWWRINAWAEVAAMISSFVTSVILIGIERNHSVLIPGIPTTDAALIITILVTTVSWVLTAYLAPQTDVDTLIAFYKKVKPFGPGWKAIARMVASNANPPAQAGATSDAETDGESYANMSICLLGWIVGCTIIWTALISIGDFLYGNVRAGALLALFTLLCGVALAKIVKLSWGTTATEQTPEHELVHNR
jgi:hypothetical protein